MENLKEQIEGIVYGYSAEEATERILKLIEDNYVRKEINLVDQITDEMVEDYWRKRGFEK